MLTPEQKTTLKWSWSKIRQATESVGAVTFLNLFETHPETLKPFLPHVNTVSQVSVF
jgi:hypothetical protein